MRKGAARIALIPPQVLDALGRGEIPTANLNEFLALDLPRLARTVAAQIGLDPDHERITDTLAMLPAFKPVRRHLHVARALYDLTWRCATRWRATALWWWRCCGRGWSMPIPTSAVSPAN